MSTVFINYRTAYAANDAHMIAKQLEKRIRGLSANIDRIIPSGASIPEEIIQMLKDSTIVLIVIHPQWRVGDERGEGDWVRQEIEIAIGLGKKFLPVLVRDARIPENLPTSIKPAFSYEAFSFRGQVIDSMDQDWRRLTDSVKRLLREFDPPPPIWGPLAMSILSVLGVFLLIWILGFWR